MVRLSLVRAGHRHAPTSGWALAALIAAVAMGSGCNSDPTNSGPAANEPTAPSFAKTGYRVTITTTCEGPTAFFSAVSGDLRDSPDGNIVGTFDFRACGKQVVTTSGGAPTWVDVTTFEVTKNLLDFTTCSGYPQGDHVGAFGTFVCRGVSGFGTAILTVQ